MRKRTVIISSALNVVARVQQRRRSAAPLSRPVPDYDDYEDADADWESYDDELETLHRLSGEPF